MQLFGNYLQQFLSKYISANKTCKYKLCLEWNFFAWNENYTMYSKALMKNLSNDLSLQHVPISALIFIAELNLNLETKQPIQIALKICDVNMFFFFLFDDNQQVTMSCFVHLTNSFKTSHFQVQSMILYYNKCSLFF